MWGVGSGEEEEEGGRTGVGRGSRGSVQVDRIGMIAGGRRD